MKAEEIELGVLDRDRLNQLMDRDLSALQQLGGPLGLAAKLSSDPRRGLDEETVVKNRNMYGTNVIPRPKAKSFFALCVDGHKRCDRHHTDRRGGA